MDARSDVYSLGVLLYELLTGHTPFEARGLLARGFDEMRRIIREMEPPRPSTRLGKQAKAELSSTASRHGTGAPELISVIRGDLDWIVMKCLEKDPSRRYPSAAELTAEIQRFIANQPIVARPPSPVYRFQKLVLRNRLAFAAGTIFFCALIAGLCITTWFVFKEHEEREQADRNRQSADSARKIAEKSRDEALAERKIAEEARQNAEAALQQSETDRRRALASENRAVESAQAAEVSERKALAAKQEAEDARKKAEDALQLAEQERRNAAAAGEKARESKSAAEAAETQAASAVNKSQEAALAAATEARWRREADAARQRAEAAAAAALAETGQWRGVLSNILSRLDTLPPSEALPAAALFFKPEDEKQPWAVPLLRQRGEWRARMGDWNNSLADFSKALALEPGDPESLRAIAPLLAEKGDWQAYRRQCVRWLASAGGQTPRPATRFRPGTFCSRPYPGRIGSRQSRRPGARWNPAQTTLIHPARRWRWDWPNTARATLPKRPTGREELCPPARKIRPAPSRPAPCWPWPNRNPTKATKPAPPWPRRRRSVKRNSPNPKAATSAEIGATG